MKSGPSEVLMQRSIIQHGLVDHMAKLTNTKALLTMDKYFSIHVPGWSEQVLDKRIRQKSTKKVGSIVVCSAFCLGSPKRDPLDSKKIACLPKLE